MKFARELCRLEVGLCVRPVSDIAVCEANTRSEDMNSAYYSLLSQLLNKSSAAVVTERSKIVQIHSSNIHYACMKLVLYEQSMNYISLK